MTDNILNFLDICHLSCPLSSVHVRLRLDQIPNNSFLTISLHGKETYNSIRSFLSALHYPIVQIEEPSEGRQNYFLTVKKT
ncbi:MULTISPECIES: sulfurtransferase TusA family protein [unclassified Saccharibacter]|uniref:sulfurtransferase TusA family protein n=1 Tax=unclassified Saccharibacter TaxID=2648722 RepID=UPI00351AEAC1